ncbi:MAG: hypothetical protein ACREQY_18105 [Candidatus Binatia bacterium]
MRKQTSRGIVIALLIAACSIAGIQACEEPGRDQAPLEPRASEQEQQQPPQAGEAAPQEQQSGSY